MLFTSDISLQGRTQHTYSFGSEITGLVGSLFRSDTNSHISKAFTLGGAGLAQLKDTAGIQAVWST